MAAFVAVELLLGARLRLGDRAELDPFVSARPAALLVLLVLIARAPRIDRAAAVLVALAAASAAEAAIVAAAGWDAAQTARAALGGLALAAALDLTARIGRAAGGHTGPALGAVAMLALLLVPGPVALYRRVALTPEPVVLGDRREVAIVTGLPLLWDERGVGATAAGPGNAALRVLARRWRFVPLARLDGAALGPHRLLLLAQPRPPGPAGLAALDAWVPRGGRVLVLADPALRWPSALPLGDPRRPPDDAGLAPLLAHWGVRLARGAPGVALPDLAPAGVARRVALVDPGRLTGCGVRGAVVATCRIGRGRATILADADLLADSAWVGEGAVRESRAARLADNPQLVGDLLDGLAGRAPDRPDLVRRHPR